MAKNQQLRNALANVELSKQPRVKEALEAILAVDPASLNSFAAPLIEYKDVWSALGLTDFDSKTTFIFDATNPTQETLYRIVAEKRIGLSLEGLSETDLQTIVKIPMDHNSIRNGLFSKKKELGLEKAFVPLFHSDDKVVTNGAANDIAKLAKEALLIKTVKGCNTPADLVQIETILKDWTASAFLKTLSVKLNDYSQDAKQRVLEQGLKLNAELDYYAFIKNLFGIAAKDADVLAELQKDNANFSKGFTAAAGSHYQNQFTGDDKAPAAKAILGHAYLKNAIQNCNDENIDNLLRVATATDVDSLHDALATFTGSSKDKFITLAAADVKACNKILAMAVHQALMYKISTCTDKETLTALSQAKDINVLNELINSSKQLGFYGEDVALKDNAFFEKTRAAAHIRNLIVQGDEHNLRNIISSAVSSTTTDVKLKNRLTNYEASKENTKSRQDALLALVKNSKTITVADLKQIGDSVGSAALQVNIAKLVGSNKADDLIKAPFETQLKTAARVEEWLKTAEGKSFGDIKTLLNNRFTVGGGFVDAGDLIKALVNPVKVTPDLAKAKAELSERMTDVLISKWDVTVVGKDKLQELAKVKGLAEFKAAMLKELGVGFDWIDEAAQRRLQQKMCDKAFELVIGSERKQLRSLLNELPLEKQQAILENPKVIPLLKKAASTNEIYLILGEFGKSATNVVKENQQLALLNRIENSKIAELLAAVPVELYENDVIEINKKLHASLNKLPDALFGNTPLALASGPTIPYVQFVNELLKTVNIGAKNPELFKKDPSLLKTKTELFNETFGLDKTGKTIDATKDAETRVRIRKQHKYNGDLIDALNSTTTPLSEKTKNVIALLMRMEKTRNFATADIKTIEDAIYKPATPKNVEELIARIHASVAIASLKAGWEKHITQEVFDDLITLNKKETLTLDLSNPRSYEAPLNGGKVKSDAIKKELDKLWSVDEYDILPELDYLSSKESESAFAWLDRKEFQAATRKNALMLQSRYTIMANHCETVVERLLTMRDDCKQELNALPEVDEPKLYKRLGSDLQVLSDPERKKVIHETKISKYKEQLLKNQKAIDHALEVYGGTLTRLNGDGTKPGVLARLAEASKKEGGVIFQGGYTSFEDVTLAEKEAHLKKIGAASSKSTPVSKLVTSGGSKEYEARDGIAPGKCRIYDAKASGCLYDASFIEEHGADTIHDVNGKTELKPNVTISVGLFPKTNKDRAEYAEAMVAQMLAALDGPPTAKNPLILKGNNSEELTFLWTALVRAGQKNPEMKFGKDAIKVVSSNFNPRDHIGFFGGIKVPKEVNKAFKDQDKASAGSSSKIDLHSSTSGYYKNKLEENKKAAERAQAADTVVNKMQKNSKVYDDMDEKNKAAEERGEKVRVSGPGSGGS